MKRKVFHFFFHNFFLTFLHAKKYVCVNIYVYIYIYIVCARICISALMPSTQKNGMQQYTQINCSPMLRIRHYQQGTISLCIYCIPFFLCSRHFTLNMDQNIVIILRHKGCRKLPFISLASRSKWWLVVKSMKALVVAYWFGGKPIERVDI